MARFTRTLFKGIAFVIIMCIAWIGIGVWEDYKRTGDLEGGSVLQSAVERAKDLPDAVTDTARVAFARTKEIFDSDDSSLSVGEDPPSGSIELPRPGTATRNPNSDINLPPTPRQLERYWEDSNEEKSLEQPALAIEIKNLERLVHELVNEQRAQDGLETLAYDDRLASIARNHSAEMATSDYFSHDNFAGENPTDRGIRQGYECRKDYGSYYTYGLAENIFQTWLYSSITYYRFLPIKNWSSEEEISVQVVEGWMNSPGHRANILKDAYDVEGIGVAISTNDKVYVTQNFC